jgi:DNA-binding transcriptional LysR family regulator
MDRLDTLLVFVSVADAGGFSEAARRLNRTPASITRAVADLEEELRVRLFNRTTRTVSLTETGARHLDIARRTLQTYAELRDLDADANAEPHGVLRITAPAHFGRLHVLPIVTAFLQRYPGIDARVDLSDRVVSLVEEGIDAAIRLGDLPDSALRATRAGQVKLGVFASPEYLARHGEPLSLADLAQHRVVSCTAITPVAESWTFEADGAATPVAVRPRLVLNGTEASAQAAAAGAGLTYLVSYQVASFVEAGRLVEVLPRFTTSPIPIQIVQPGGRFPTAKARLFIEAAARALRSRFGE